MTHKDFQERILLMHYDELDASERQRTQEHLDGCGECREFQKELEKLHGVLESYSPVEVSDGLLLEARDRLRTALRAAPPKRSLWDGIGSFIDGLLVPQYKVALGAAMTIAFGFFLGYMVFRSAPNEAPAFQIPVQPANQESQVVKDAGQIANVRNISTDKLTGEVEFTFDAVMPVHMKGSINDPKVQQVLAHALLDEQNPGVRLRTVAAIASENANHPDNDVRDILIMAALTDNVVGVRMEALKALQKFPLDAKLKKTFLDILTNDENSAIRIAAINALASAPKGSATDQEFLDVLKQSMQSDKNDYIRLRAKAVLEENKQ